MFYSQEGLRSCRCVFGQCKVAPRVIFRLLSPILFSHPPLGTLGRGTGEKSCLVICCHWQCRMVFYVVKIEKHEAYSIKASLVEHPLPFSNLQCTVKEWYKNYNCVIGIGFILAVHLFYPDDKSVSIIDKVVEVFFATNFIRNPLLLYQTYSNWLLLTTQKHGIKYKCNTQHTEYRYKRSKINVRNEKIVLLIQNYFVECLLRCFPPLRDASTNWCPVVCPRCHIAIAVIIIAMVMIRMIMLSHAFL